MVICSIGDLTLDVIVRLAGPVYVAGDTDAEIRLVPGGQGANVAAWSAALGARARLIAKRGADEAGRLAGSGLQARGVDVLGPAEGRNGIICALVSPDGERSMASDRASGASLRPEELEEAWFEDCDHLFVSGYALMREPARSAAFRAVELARRADATVSIDLASWSAIQGVGANEFRELVVAFGPDLVFANDDEDRIVGGSLPGVRWVVKRGSGGCSFDGVERNALPVDRAVDSTGAGDALAAGFVIGGPDLALEAAARCVQQLGAMPA
jgi:sugar/nucleoside kinase (ribokinase family)